MPHTLVNASRSIRPFAAALPCLALACTLAGAPAAAQHNPLRSHAIAHRITPGDTLEHLARHYLGDARLWPALQSHNHMVSPYQLRPGAILEIPLQLMHAASASVDQIQGTAQVLRSSAVTVPVAPGMSLQEGDRLQLDPQAFVTVRLADGSTVQVQAASTLALHQLRRRGRSGSLQSVLEVQQGGVEVRVPGKPDAQRRLEVLTPVAATSVRGTQFDVQLLPDGSTTSAVLAGQVTVQALADVHQPTPSARLAPLTGMAVTADGHARPATALLRAATAQELPTLNEDAQWLQLPLPVWPQAQSWRVSVREAGPAQRVLRNGQFDGSSARFSAIDDGDYVLQVRAVDAQGISGIPANVPLRVKAHPVAPLVQTPAPAAILAQGEAQLQCTPVDGVHSYRHEVIALPTPDAAAPASAFAQPVLQHTSTGQCALDLRSLPSGSYAWRAASVRTLQGQDDAGPFAVAHAFQIAPRPAAPSLDDMPAQLHAGLTTLHWPAAPGQRFRLQAFATPEGGTPSLDTVLDAPQWTASGLPAGTWYVRIQVQDPSGLHSAFSPPRSVQVLALVRDGAGQPIQSGTGLGFEHR